MAATGWSQQGQWPPMPMRRVGVAQSGQDGGGVAWEGWWCW